MSVSDLTGTTWLINDTTTDPANTIDAYINFVSNSVNFVKIRIYDGSEPGTEQCITCTTQDQEPIIFYEHGWTDEAYRTIAITGGEDATNSSLITWLENNATQVVQTGDVIVSYAGADIVTMSDSGTKTLKTQGKYCTDDITIEYTKPSGGGGASNFVHGTFTTGSTAGATSIEIPYTGSGHPVMAVVVVAGGAYNPAYSQWYDASHSEAVGQWTMTKAVMSSTPTYTTSGKENEGVTIGIYKFGKSSTDYTRYMQMNTNVFTSNDPQSNLAVNCVCFKSNTTLSYLSATTKYGLLADTDYEYFIVYSE